jgi:hypothetical protein
LEKYAVSSESEKTVFPSVYTNTKESAAVIGIDGASVVFTVRLNEIYPYYVFGFKNIVLFLLLAGC